MNNNTKLFAVIVGLTILLSSSNVSAIEYSGTGGRPAYSDPKVENSANWFIYNLQPGEIKEDALIVNSAAAEPQRVMIYPADTTPSSDGGFALKQRVEPMTEIGTWIRLYPDEPPTTTSKILREIYTGTELKTLNATSTIINRCDPITKDPETIAKLKLSKEAADYLPVITKWCQGLTQYELTVPPNNEILIPFIISIPQEAEIGEHSGALMIERLQAETTKSGATGIAITTRVGVRIYETVPGEINYDLLLKDFRYRYESQKNNYIFSVEVANQGNTSRQLDLTVKISDTLFHKNDETLERSASIQKNDVLISNFEWPRPWFGRFRVTAEAKSSTPQGQQTQTSNELIVWVIPWNEISITLLIIIFLIALFFYWRYMRRKIMRRHNWQPYKVKRGETITQLANRAHVSWKLLAKVNHLPKPYILEMGLIIKLPAAGHTKPHLPRTKPKPRRPKTTKFSRPKKIAKSPEIITS